jgi:hypothetical protein
MLSVQLYRRSENISIEKEDTRTLTVQSKKTNIHEGPEQKRAVAEGTSEVEILMIPIEDVIQITCKGETKASVHADAESSIVPKHVYSENCWDRCCATILNFCRKIYECCFCCCQKSPALASRVHTQEIIRFDPTLKTDFKEESLPAPPEEEDCCSKFCNDYCCCCSCCPKRCWSDFCDNCCRCWCCRKQKITGFIKRTKAIQKEEAQRAITITIEYSKYSNLDTPTNTRLLK